MKEEIEETFEKALKEFCSKQWDKHIEDINKEKDVFITGMAFNLMKMVEFNSMNDRLIITLRKDIQK